ncbi:head decoration protein [Rhizobium sp. RU36D]|uniref:head decoration protein n=1 Tax=Rhizobium sp. RU36D TaxID=1907415 RepID=UPI0009D8C8F5|nr:head decoration protein [Rhizobium sp. RU36D]SMD18161.1 Bacteriophage lambda head decoration protein D [Rhizobium sp. RU36D]
MSHLPYMKIAATAGMSSLLKKEIDPEFCRATATLLAGDGSPRELKMGEFVGKLKDGGATTVTVTTGTNAGNGVLTLGAPSYTAAVKPGRYTVTYLVEKANGGEFEVEGPNGAIVGAGKTGTLFGKQVRFTIADGATDFAVGDQFFIDVGIAPGVNDGKVVAWDPAGTDGRQIIHGICLKTCVAADGEDAPGAVLYSRRLSIINATAIVWPDGITADAAARALVDIEERLGLIART